MAGWPFGGLAWLAEIDMKSGLFGENELTRARALQPIPLMTMNDDQLPPPTEQILATHAAAACHGVLRSFNHGKQGRSFLTIVFRIHVTRLIN